MSQTTQIYYDLKLKTANSDDDCPGYASVTWFGAPEYPAHPNPVLVKCREVDVENRLLDTYGSVIRITQIDPTQVLIEREEDHIYCWMMRDTGYDTIRDD